MQKTATFLMFSGEQFGKAEEAIKLYTSLFENSTIGKLEYFQQGEEGGEAGTVKEAVFTLAGREYMAHDSAMAHSFQFTPSISIFATFDKEEELDKVYRALAAGGFELMPLGDYGFSKKFGWLQDKFGVSWQLSLE